MHSPTVSHRYHNIPQYMSSQFFENEPREICSHLSERRSKGISLVPDKLEKHTRKEKGKGEIERARGRREGSEKKGMVALLAFILATLCRG